MKLLLEICAIIVHIFSNNYICNENDDIVYTSLTNLKVIGTIGSPEQLQS